MVSWNACDDLRACLASLANATLDPATIETVVVDNASTDGSPEMVEREFPRVKLIRLSTNTGFSGGNNVALENLTAEFAFLLNSDAVCESGAIDGLLDYADFHPDAGMLGPKVLNPDGSLQYSCRRWPTPAAGIFRNVWIGRWFPRNRPAADYLMRDYDHETPRAVDWLSGCALMVRRTCVEKIGLLDGETFFFYCEDMDWCLRAHQAGFGVEYVPSAVVRHKIGGSTDQVADKMIVEHSRSMVKFWRKHREFFADRVPWWAGVLVLPWASLRAGVRILRRRFQSDSERRRWREKREIGS